MLEDLKVGEITRVPFQSEILDREVTLSIYLPKDYSDLFKSKVVICFDGRDFFQFGQIHRSYEKLRQEDKVSRAIFIGFHYESVQKRREEFHPQGERASKTVQAVANELLPFIDSNFPTYKVGNARLLLGDSLAGSIAFLTGLSYPRVFSQVGMMSPHSDEVVETLLDRCQFKSELNVWHTIGLEEEDFKLPTNGKPANFLTPNRHLKDLINQTDMTYHYEELDGGHNWKTWKNKIDELLMYFLTN
ncbi:alpha/beta hydrolase-fold protein [Staphylococcus massiliensis]|uniref:Putative esterase n=1 Tax=Staphylococcus massiliensis S46 TaxID=1229783 RepID=K9ALD4_9STAP|nr:alpha/beta hydrolase-fold protein [Staphylococcus massiliensis]EKU48109.1 putative esterase [Staphylococcus massiliensis S46]MCG3399845.1 esterase family protein [Staphylococcus massiliensis]MCG3401582.1 esterase family protein [Staphylococcus massiliensis]MCG3412116.1 esterase family protein [Staphylococcus massiliensis]PNZ98216.1 esterase family protein [Staphylococcus massiliensis CCUG 55927]